MIELLVVIVIMVVISTVVFRISSYSMKMERAVAVENELQREARFIMEQISNIVRDGGTLEIVSLDESDITDDKIIVRDKNGVEKLSYQYKQLKLEPGGNILSDNIDQFDVTTGSEVKIKLVLKDKNNQYEVSTNVTNDFNNRVRTYDDFY
ncbi:hypothetical protein NC799_08575 [Aquibacillus sp. 3ASR75-54]|uniref:Uncharacterized protein n=1 Tax=Aquibacillus salsiterrae TaxID=2950439 RepID=A0A9X3WEH8_9BACI|nr:hypothetical protein [Aquibacillus salsiterrae]